MEWKKLIRLNVFSFLKILLLKMSQKDKISKNLIFDSVINKNTNFFVDKSANLNLLF